MSFRGDFNWGVGVGSGVMTDDVGMFGSSSSRREVEVVAVIIDEVGDGLKYDGIGDGDFDVDVEGGEERADTIECETSASSTDARFWFLENLQASQS